MTDSFLLCGECCWLDPFGVSESAGVHTHHFASSCSQKTGASWSASCRSDSCAELLKTGFGAGSASAPLSPAVPMVRPHLWLRESPPEERRRGMEGWGRWVGGGRLVFPGLGDQRVQLTLLRVSHQLCYQPAESSSGDAKTPGGLGFILCKRQNKINTCSSLLWNKSCHGHKSSIAVLLNEAPLCQSTYHPSKY